MPVSRLRKATHARRPAASCSQAHGAQPSHPVGSHWRATMRDEGGWRRRRKPEPHNSGRSQGPSGGVPLQRRRGGDSSEGRAPAIRFSSVSKPFMPRRRLEVRARDGRARRCWRGRAQGRAAARSASQPDRLGGVSPWLGGAIAASLASWNKYKPFRFNVNQIGYAGDGAHPVACGQHRKTGTRPRASPASLCRVEIDSEIQSPRCHPALCESVRVISQWGMAPVEGDRT